MAFCPNCGSQVQGAFCANCGTSMASASAAAGGNPAGPSASAYAPPPAAQAASLEPHIASALCYTPFIIGLVAAIIFLLVAPFNQNKFVRFNAFQSLFLHLALFVAGVALGVVTTILTAIIHVFALILIPVWPLLWVGSIILFLFMMYKSFNNHTVKLPFIGDLAEKQA